MIRSLELPTAMAIEASVSCFTIRRSHVLCLRLRKCEKKLWYPRDKYEALSVQKLAESSEKLIFANLPQFVSQMIFATSLIASVLISSTAAQSPFPLDGWVIQLPTRTGDTGATDVDFVTMPELQTYSSDALKLTPDGTGLSFKVCLNLF